MSHYTDCVRTYSIDNGQDQVAAIAQRHGMKVLQGILLSPKPDVNRRQIATVIALAKRYPDVIRAIVVGNEVLLRGDMSVTDLEAILREVKAQVSQPVTYADVWEYWLRYSDLQNFVDFVTIHILPYWEDFPLPASLAAAHVDDIRRKVAAAIPNKEIVVGEVGWPSAGRMREGALPSPSNQARAIEETVALAQRENFRLNVIEAFDQPWKRQLEGATGGYWGIFDRATAAPKFSFDGNVSDHPHWLVQALAGILLAALSFGGAAIAGNGKTTPPLLWLRIAALAFAPAVLFGWTIERVPIDSFTAGGWLRSLALAITAAAAPIACAAACAAGRSAPAFASVHVGGGRGTRSIEPHSRLDPDRADLAFGAGRARSGFRSALPRHTLCAAERRRYCFPGADAVDAAPVGTARIGGDRRCRRAGAGGGLYRVQRNLRQLAGHLAVRRISRPRRHSAAGAGRARLRINKPAASAERSALCSTMPNPAAASATVTSTSDGRIRLRSAATKATPPKTS